MGGQIAQAIASSDVPVVVKDVKQDFVDHAIEEVRNVTSGQLAGLVKKEKLTQEQADARLEEVMGLVTGTVTYEEFGDVDFGDRTSTKGFFVSSCLKTSSRKARMDLSASLAL